MGNEILQEAGEMVALAESHVGAQEILVDDAQVEVVAERMHMHEVPHLVTLLREEHRELWRDKESRHECYQALHTLLQSPADKAWHSQCSCPSIRAGCSLITLPYACASFPGKKDSANLQTRSWKALSLVETLLAYVRCSLATELPWKRQYGHACLLSQTAWSWPASTQTSSALEKGSRHPDLTKEKGAGSP